MKKLLFFLISAALLSCQGGGINGPTVPSDGYLSYTNQGATVTFTGPQMTKVTVNSPGSITNFYDIRGQEGPNNAVKLLINTDSLKCQGYAADILTSVILINGASYSAYRAARPGFISVNISRHSGGIVEGTFTGKLYGVASPADSITVSGEFHNTQVNY